MIRSRLCSWCHRENKVGPGRANVCGFCGHRADVNRSECDCPNCKPGQPMLDAYCGPSLVGSGNTLGMVLDYVEACFARGLEGDVAIFRGTKLLYVATADGRRMEIDGPTVTWRWDHAPRTDEGPVNNG